MKICNLLSVILILLCHCQFESDSQSEKESQSQKRNHTYIPAYEEEVICSMFAISKYGVIEERLRVFNKVNSTDAFNNIDSICAFGIKSLSQEKSVFIETWRFRDSIHAYKIFSLLENIKKVQVIKYKPPTFWDWVIHNNSIVFFYSYDAPPTDTIFLQAMNTYQMMKREINCCEP